jgi:hypothetical protein
MKSTVSGRVLTNSCTSLFQTQPVSCAFSARTHYPPAADMRTWSLYPSRRTAFGAMELPAIEDDAVCPHTAQTSSTRWNMGVSLQPN